MIQFRCLVFIAFAAICGSATATATQLANPYTCVSEKQEDGSKIRLVVMAKDASTHLILVYKESDEGLSLIDAVDTEGPRRSSDLNPPVFSNKGRKLSLRFYTGLDEGGPAPIGKSSPNFNAQWEASGDRTQVRCMVPFPQ